MIDQFKIDLVVSGTIEKHQSDDGDASDVEEDPYEVAKQSGKFATIESTYDLTTDKIIDRILHNRKNFLETYKAKNKK